MHDHVPASPIRWEAAAGPGGAILGTSDVGAGVGTAASTARHAILPAGDRGFLVVMVPAGGMETLDPGALLARLQKAQDGRFVSSRAEAFAAAALDLWDARMKTASAAAVLPQVPIDHLFLMRDGANRARREAAIVELQRRAAADRAAARLGPRFAGTPSLEVRPLARQVLDAAATAADFHRGRLPLLTVPHGRALALPISAAAAGGAVRRELSRFSNADIDRLHAATRMLRDRISADPRFGSDETLREAHDHLELGRRALGRIATDRCFRDPGEIEAAAAPLASEKGGRLPSWIRSLGPPSRSSAHPALSIAP